MTDKQIIINGVDIGWCKNYNEANSKDCETLYICAENPNCYYKQLKRSEAQCEAMFVSHTDLEKKYKAKEQECEELKEKLKEMNEVIRTETTRCSLVNILKAELDQLKAENEELTTINARLLGGLEVDETDTSLVFNLDKELRQKEKEFYTAIQKVVKLKQTLTEIKEIAESDNHYCSDGTILRYEVVNKILQKISEVEE